MMYVEFRKKIFLDDSRELMGVTVISTSNFSLHLSKVQLIKLRKQTHCASYMLTESTVKFCNIQGQLDIRCTETNILSTNRHENQANSLFVPCEIAIILRNGSLVSR